MASAVMLASGIALAATIDCAATDREGFCEGTPEDDSMIGTNAAERIWSYGGNDRLYGGKGADRLEGFGGRDLLNGGPNDNIRDRIIGGPGDDTFVESTGPDDYEFWGSWGKDTITGQGDPPDMEPSDGLAPDLLDFIHRTAQSEIAPPIEVDLASGKATRGPLLR